MAALFCEKHPDYQVKGKPTSNCPTCVQMWERKFARRVCANPNCKKVFCWKGDSDIRYHTQACGHAMRVKPEDTLATAARVAAGRPNDLDVVKTENTELRAELTRATGIIRTYQDKHRFEDKLMAEIVGFIEQNPYRPVLVKPSPGIKTDGKATAHEMMANVSDAHFPERVDPSQTFGLDYGADICRRRLEYLRDKVIRYADLRRSAYPVQKLTVNVNGDMLSGDIHEELEVTNEFPMTEAVVKMAYMLFDMGCAFSEVFPSVEFIVMPGNHPRIQKKPRFKQKWNNWEYLMGQFIGALAGDRFKVTVPKDLVYQFNIFSQRIGVTHGDGQKVQAYAGIPYYGMEKRRTKLQALLKQLNLPQLDLLCYGHFHQMIFEEGQGCSMFINGSIKGGDEYSTGTTYAAQAPVQGLMTFHPRHGLTDLSRINLGHIK